MSGIHGCLSGSGAHVFGLCNFLRPSGIIFASPEFQVCQGDSLSELSSNVGGGRRLIKLANARRRFSFSSGATHWGNQSQFSSRGERFSSIWCGAGEGMHVAWPRQHYTFGRRRVSARSVSQSDTDMYADDWERHKGEHDWRGLRRAPRCYESTCDDGRRPEGCVERMMSPSGLLRACTVRWAVWLDEAIACVCVPCDHGFG